MKTDDKPTTGSQLDNGNGLNNEMYKKRVEKIARNEGVVKGAQITALIGFIILIAAGVIFYSMFKREQKRQMAMMEDQKYSFTELLTQRDSTINDWVVTFDQIEKNLASIKEKEKIITLNASDREFSKDRKQQIMEDINYINTLLDQNKKKIASLNEQLKKSGGTIRGLQTKVTELEAAMKQSEIEITDLKTALTEKNFKIEQLNSKVSDMQVSIEQKDQTINTQIAEMNKAFVTTGTFKQLKAKGLVAKEGGFLGIGKNKSLKENFPDSLFSQIDITVTKSIPVNSKTAKLITEHPVGSYELVRESKDKIASIDIKDPAQFWKISKYAVVEINK
ncbi:MAG: hypothetical protein IPJ37_09100 [Bacteroidales bacterium]|nr:hypothetical protein [Bacteroidales bacterium]